MESRTSSPTPVATRPRTARWGAPSDTDEQIERNLEFQTYNALIDNDYLNVDNDPRYGLPQEAFVYNNGSWQLDPALYNSDPADADPAVQNAFNDWQNGPDANEPRSEHNGSPNDVFQDYLNALASRIAHH